MLRFGLMLSQELYSIDGVRCGFMSLKQDRFRGFAEIGKSAVFLGFQNRESVLLVAESGVMLARGSICGESGVQPGSASEALLPLRRHPTAA
jgi:hypothetical protein